MEAQEEGGEELRKKIKKKNSLGEKNNKNENRLDSHKICWNQ